MTHAKNDFLKIHKVFENKQADLWELQKETGFDGYLLIRSLDNAQLEKLLRDKNLVLPTRGGVIALYQAVFDSRLTIIDIKKYILDSYPEIKKERLAQEEYLPKIIQQFGQVKCGVRNDNLHEVAQSLVRDKGIKSYEELQKRLTDITENTIRGYIEWQYYNQATNDLIEHFFNDHEKVIPTLRKIKYVDFILNIEGKHVPFDLKITHISDDYFDLLSRGLDQSSSSHDDFVVGNNSSELDEIKKFYKTHKKEYSLANYGGLGKSELLEEMKNKLPPSIYNPFYKVAVAKRRLLVSETEKCLKKLEWWNYKFQGERLFKNNNRFFIFLVYTNSFDDARPLKGRIKEIGKKIKERLDSISTKNLNTINYTYEKDQSVNGDYSATSCSILINGEI